MQPVTIGFAFIRALISERGKRETKKKLLNDDRKRAEVNGDILKQF